MIQGVSGPPFFSKILGIDFYSGFSSEEMHSIDFYSGSKKKKLKGGGVQFEFEILKKIRYRLL